MTRTDTDFNLTLDLSGASPKKDGNSGAAPQTSNDSKYSIAMLASLSLAMARDFRGIEPYFPARLWEATPHIIHHLSAIWGSSDVAPYLGGLLVSDRAGRAGFSSALIQDILFLRELHNFLYPPEGAIEIPRVEDAFHKATEPRTLAELARRYGTLPPDYVPRGKDPLADSPTRPCGWGELSSAAALLEALNARVAHLSNRDKGEAHYTARPRVGEILVENGVISVFHLEQALDEQRNDEKRHRLIGEILCHDHMVDEEDLIKAICLQSGYLLVDLDAIAMSHEAFSFLSRDQANELSAVPLLKSGNTLVVVIDEPFLKRTSYKVSLLEKLTGCTVCVGWAPSAAIERRLNNYAAGRIEKRI